MFEEVNFYAKILDFVNNKFMLPYNNTGHSNYIPDPYSHAGYFTSQLYFVPEETALLYKPPAENEN